jgi:D-proline reductase (dithiol) PrdB
MIPYIERTKNYYERQGYPAYQWAHHESTPFQSMVKPLKECTLALVTTAAPFKPELADQGPGAKYNADAKFYDVYAKPIEPMPDLRISHIGYDRQHCEAKDARTWLPVDALKLAEGDGTVGAIAGELVGIPTNRSQRVTLEQDAPNALAHIQRQNVDIALLVPT